MTIWWFMKSGLFLNRNQPKRRLIYDEHSKLGSALGINFLAVEMDWALVPSHRTRFRINRQPSTFGRQLTLIHNSKLNYLRISIRLSWKRHTSLVKPRRAHDHRKLITARRWPLERGCPGEKKYKSYLSRVPEIVLWTSNVSWALEHRQIRMQDLKTSSTHF